MLQRLLIEKMEHRIIVGILSFLGIMVLVGWIAINEGGRMQAFTRQYEARAIERGAALYNTNCASCHGADGRGMINRAPALNSPYLFGHDFLAEIDREILRLERERDNATTPPTEERRAEIDTELANLQTERNGLITQMQAAVDKGYDPDAPARLLNVGFGGSLYQFIYTTLEHGRPGSVQLWPASGGGMVAWGQEGGGQLRGDQLDDLTQFVLNWDRGDDWTMDDLLAVNQFPIIPTDSRNAAAPVESVGTDVAAISAALVNVTGDSVSGQALYTSLGCAGCHSVEAVAPLTSGTWSAAQTVRLEAPENAGLTAEEYLITSVVNPGAYTVPPYPSGAMPGNFGQQLDLQGLADILAYLESYDS
jgi:mono/diheme cytochrome c family protein